MGQVNVDLQAVVSGWLKDLRQCEETELDAYFGKRAQPRFHIWSEPLEIRFDDEVFIARGENLGTNGAGVVCRQSLSRGDEVELRCVGEQPWVPARVQHCTQTVGSYKIGLQFLY